MFFLPTVTPSSTMPLPGQSLPGIVRCHLEAGRCIVAGEGARRTRYPLDDEQVCSLADMGNGCHAPAQQGFGLRIIDGLKLGHGGVEVIGVSGQGKLIDSGDADRANRFGVA